MVTKNEYIQLINQIAGLYCKTNAVCREGVKSRLKNYFTDGLFAKFLQNLERGQVGAHWFKIIKWNTLGSHATIKLYWLNLVNGKSGEVDLSGVPKHILEGSFDTYYSYIESKLDPNAVTWGRVEVDNKGYAIVYSPTHGSYGISLTPPTIPGDPPTIIPTPPAPPLVTGSPASNATGSPEGGLSDLLNLLSNPIVLIGVALGGYFIWKGSK